MKYLLTILWILQHFRGRAGFFSTVRCPRYLHDNILQNPEFESSSFHCTLLMSCEDPLKIYSKNDEIETRCEGEKFFHDNFLFDCFTNDNYVRSTKLKVTTVQNFNTDSSLNYPCPRFQDSSDPILLPVSGNCSQFYKCDWGKAVLFECPSELHFNAELQVCDWPWRAQCDFTWNNCPRPHPKCPINYPGTFYLPHPHVCDKFYQCDWGTSYLQSCPPGLHFNPTFKICDWPHNANCQVC